MAQGAAAAVSWSYTRRNLTLALLCLVAFFNLVDRQIMAIMLEPIRKEFGVSDTEIGLLTGSSFAIFYTLSAIPFARLADRTRRSTIVVVALAIWSLLTTVGGLVTSFAQLGLTRVGVALGEAGSNPPTSSMLTDLYPLRHRAKAYALYSASTSIGVGAAIIVGGALVESIGWRMTLIVIGAPGILLALILLLVLREPPRGMSDELKAPVEDRLYGIRETFRYLWSVPSYRYAVILSACGGCAGFGLQFWGPTFLMRVHGLSSAQVGMSFGMTTLCALVVGQVLTGVVVDLAARRDLRAAMWIAGGGLLLGIPFGLVFAFADDWRLAVAGFGMMAFLISPHNFCAIVMAQSLAPSRMRGTTAMILGLATSAFGAGVSPFLLGAVNDLLRGSQGDFAIRYSIAFALIFLLFAALAAFAAARTIRADHHRFTSSGGGAASPAEEAQV